MARCEVCGNDYDETLSVTVARGAAGGKVHCCANCARRSGEKGMFDRA